ncbi:CapA family protein [Crocinitomix algicola]|uniref:CapA family protein n=1 Tax=Crocinitomix algicola TaxID=1740263 RepID=UPI00087228AB|nr:CapA family protein [Crocinitomix algicola]
MLNVILRSAFLLLIGFILGCTPKKESLKILFAGDLLLDRGVKKRIEYLGADNLFRPEMTALFAQHNIVIANLECPVTKIEAPINKRFIFRGEPEVLETLQLNGITHLNMANNHAMDQGRKGLVDTDKNIRKYGMKSTGYGVNSKKACEPVLLSNEPRAVYLISSLRVPSENWTYLAEEPSVCEQTVEEICQQVQFLKKKDQNAIVLIQLHWGAEHQPQPLLSQIQQARQLIDAGADAIVGHHPHTIQTIEFYKEKPIYYSIGNFIFDQNNPINSAGLLIGIEISTKKITFKEHPFTIKQSVPHLN